MLVRWLYWVFIAILLRFVWRSFSRGVLAQLRGGSRATDPMPTVYKGLMVLDPVCGVHIPESRALVEVRAGERIHFCSEVCRAAFRSDAN